MEPVKITQVKISVINKDKLKAYASITFNDCFVVKDIRIIQGNSGNLFLSMPNKKNKQGEFKDIVHPINQETRQMLEQTIFEAYEKELANTENS